MDLACWLHQPVHNTNHDGGEVIFDDGSMSSDSYEQYVKRKTLAIIKPYRNKKVCKNDDGLINRLNAFSDEVRDNVLNFVWTISKDGHNYAPGSTVGCGNVPPNINSGKAKQGDCTCGRNHVINKLSQIKEKIEQTQQIIANFN